MSLIFSHVDASPPPSAPDLYSCDRAYGEGLRSISCLALAVQLQRGSSAIPYTVGIPGALPSYALPILLNDGQLFLTYSRLSKLNSARRVLCVDCTRRTG